MKYAALLVILCILTGCASANDCIDKAMTLRKDLLEADQCTFDAAVTAHYEDAVYSFQMTCSADKSGKLSFTVTDPDSISGISGSISQDSAALTFDKEVLAFPILADDQLSPVSAPWIFYNTLRSGYLSGGQEADDGFILSMDDSYEENPLHLQIQTDSECVPFRAEIFYQEKLILSLNIKNFTVV